MNTALSMIQTTTATETETNVVEILDAARNLVDSLNTSLETAEGAGRAEVAKALAAVLNSVARRLDR